MGTRTGVQTPDTLKRSTMKISRHAARLAAASDAQALTDADAARLAELAIAFTARGYGHWTLAEISRRVKALTPTRAT